MHRWLSVFNVASGWYIPVSLFLPASDTLIVDFLSMNVLQ